MAVYTVHAPAGYGVDVRARPDQFVFVRDGFYFWAFVLSILWLVWHRLWLALLGYLALTLAVEIALWSFGASAGTRFVVMGLIALLLGLEAGSLRRWKLSRRKWRQIDVVVADSEEAAERRFFDRWHAAAPRDGAHGAAALHPLPHASLAQGAGIIGLFPEPGAMR
jgi:hypothetical protein